MALAGHDASLGASACAHAGRVAGHARGCITNLEGDSRNERAGRGHKRPRRRHEAWQSPIELLDAGDERPRCSVRSGELTALRHDRPTVLNTSSPTPDTRSPHSATAPAAPAPRSLARAWRAAARFSPRAP